MTVKDCVKAMMKDRGYTQTILAEKIGKRQSDIGMYLMRSEKMQINNLMNMANACNFDIELVDRSDRSRAYVIGDEPVREEPVQQKMPDLPGKDTVGEITPLFEVPEGKWPELEAMIRKVVEQELSKR